jgi:hypothetical protein
VGKTHAQVVNNNPEAKGTKKGGQDGSIVPIRTEQDA